MKKYTLFSAFLCISILVCAQDSKLSNYSRFFIESQKEHEVAAHNNKFRKAFALKVDQNEQEYISAFIHFDDEEADKSVIEKYGAVIESDFGKIITATISIDQLEALANEESISYIEISKPIRKKMSEARTLANVDKVQAGTDISNPFLGTGVVVGIIDGGFQYNHVNFYDINDPSELRVKRVMRYYDSSRASGYTTKKEYTTQEAIEAAKYDNSEDDSGHATHVAGIAAGSYGYGTNKENYGVAPDADLVFVAYGSAESDVANGIKYIFNYADSENKPAVVNMSLGSHIGPHDGTSTFDQLCNSLTKEGHIIVGSAGNEGDSRLFWGKELTAGEVVSDFVEFPEVGYSYDGKGGYFNQIDIWGDPGQTYAIIPQVTDKSGKVLWTGNEFYFVPTSTKTTDAKTYSSFGSSGAKGTIKIFAEQCASNNKLNYTLYISDGYSLYYPGNTKLKINISAKSACSFRSWCDGDVCWENNGVNDHTTGEIGGTAWGVISVGAYTSRVNLYSDGSKVGKIAGFSSMGPTADGRMKPDIAAPGDVVFSSIPNITSVTSTAQGKKYETINGTKYYWGYMSGTSMSAPFVTGVLATWLQANPKLDISRIREIMQATAIQDSYTGACPNNTYGYGKIDAYAGIVKVLATVDVKQLESLDLPDAIMLYPNPNKGAFKLLFTNVDSNVKVSVYATNGQQVDVRTIGEVLTQQELDIDLQGIQNGSYIVKIQGNKTNTTCRLMVR